MLVSEFYHRYVENESENVQRQWKEQMAKWHGTEQGMYSYFYPIPMMQDFLTEAKEENDEN